jgi:hypothetical protein
MKMSITYRLFFLILCATSMAIIFLLLIMWWNINQGFYQYLGTVDQKKLAQVVADLGKKYEQQGSWDFLKHTPPRWNSSGAMPFLQPGMDHPPLPFPNENPPMGPPPEPMMKDRKSVV